MRRSGGRSKGQNIVINEVLLFALGILITVHVVNSFSTMQSSLRQVSTTDQFTGVADIISSAAVQAASSNASIVAEFPEKISEEVYVISLKDDSVIIYDLGDPDTKVSQKLFNIAQTDCSSEGVFCLDGEVLSTAGRAEIYVDGKTIKIRRA